MHKCKKHPCPKPETCKCRTVREAQVPVIWMIGGAGSGKAAVGRALNEKFGFDYLSTGDLLRQAAKNGGHKAQTYERAIGAGRLVDDDDVVQLLEKTMRQLLQKKSKGYVVSFAKNLLQAELFERFIAPSDLILLLECTDETMLARSKARAAAAGEMSDVDDMEETVRTRIEQFRSTLDDLKKSYGPKIKTIDAEATLEEVMAKVEPIVEEVRLKKLAMMPKPTCDE